MSKQMTLFGAWKTGTAEQQRLLDAKEADAASRLQCPYCAARIAGAGPLELHCKTQHSGQWQKEQSVFCRSALSLGLQQSLVDLLGESRGDEVAAPGDDDAPDDLQQFVRARPGDEEAASPAPDGRRGAPKRHRYTVKHKYNTVLAIEKLRQELTDAAAAADVRPPTLDHVFDRLATTGVCESKNTLYSWIRSRAELTRVYLSEKHVRKKKTVGSGRKPVAVKAEAAVQAYIAGRRGRSLRVSRTSVKALLRGKVAEVESEEVRQKLRFSKKYFSAAFQRMGVVVRRISSCKPVTNEVAAQVGRYFCRQLIELRKTGTHPVFAADTAWHEGFVKDSVFGFFEPSTIFSVDEVPFNFAAEGSSVVLKNSDAAVRTLRGTGKRFGTCIIMCSAAGKVAKFVLIFKRKTQFPKCELDHYARLPNVIVTYSESSYVNEDIWMKQVVDLQLYNELKTFGRDFYKRRYLLVSDFHSAHHTDSVLEHCAKNHVWPVFTPPNYTTHWSLIDDFVGTNARSKVYAKAEAFETAYFEQKPDGDGGVAAATRRMEVASWWNQVYDELQSDEAREKHKGAAKRVGLYVTENKPADGSYLPVPVRFRNSVFSRFGETLYDESHPDFNNVKEYVFATKPKRAAKNEHVQPGPAMEDAHDEDGYSHEEMGVWMADEAEYKSDSDDAPSEDDVGQIAEEHFARAATRRREAAAGGGGVVSQYDALDAAEGRPRRGRK